MTYRRRLSELELRRIRSCFDSNINVNHLNHLIQRFPKVFLRIIQECKEHKFKVRHLNLPGMNEKIKFESCGKKIKMRIEQKEIKNFYEKFQNLIDNLYEELDVQGKYKIKTKKSLMEQGFDPQVISEVENNLKQDWLT